MLSPEHPIKFLKPSLNNCVRPRTNKRQFLCAKKACFGVPRERTRNQSYVIAMFREFLVRRNNNVVLPCTDAESMGVIIVIRQ